MKSDFRPFRRSDFFLKQMCGGEGIKVQSSIVTCFQQAGCSCLLPTGHCTMLCTYFFHDDDEWEEEAVPVQDEHADEHVDEHADEEVVNLHLVCHHM